MDDEIKDQFHHWWAWPLVGLLAVILAGMLVWFGLDIRDLNKQGIISPTLFRAGHHSPGSQPLAPAQIQGWMTFRYITFVFHLPPNYLANGLNIDSPKYLNMTLYNYAKAQKLDGAIFVQSAREVVAGYQGGTGP